MTSAKEMPMSTAIAGNSEGTFESAGLRIHYRSWRPPTPARAILVIVPGFNSHSGYYEWTAEQLLPLGVAVYAIDLRGRGQSDGERFFVATFNDYVDDLSRLIELARVREPGLPVYLLGHSAGGVVASLYTLQHQATLAGLLCESFAYQLPAPGFALAVFKGLGHVFPHAHVLRLKNEDFSRDPDVVARMNADPLIAHETQPTQTLAELVRADEQLTRGFPTMTLPLLILHGTADKAAKAGGSQTFFDAARSTDKTLKLYDGYAHDLLNDTGKEIVLADISDWLNRRLPS